VYIAEYHAPTLRLADWGGEGKVLHHVRVVVLVRVSTVDPALRDILDERVDGVFGFE
jgi:hypothetical protein